MFKEHKLLKRFLSGVILAPITLLIIHLGGTVYELIVLLLCVLMAGEWAGMLNKSFYGKAAAGSSLGWYILGFIYIFTPCACLLFLRSLPEGRVLVFWLVLSVWAIDIGAYFFGIALKGPKIAPSISPKKTWAGLIGGIICSSTVGFIFDKYWLHTSFNIVLVSIILTFIAQAGDFFESAVKRRFKLKDSGNLIPGHGGILDRVDGLITASIFVTLLVVYGKL
jgi:phosphatidate cytidylyltransferase